MRLYPRTPWYWYGALMVVILAMAIGMVEGYKTTLPWWAVILAAVIPAFYMIPCGIIHVQRPSAGKYHFQYLVYGCCWARSLLCTRHETGSLPQNSTSHALLCTRKRYHLRRPDTSRRRPLDARQCRKHLLLRPSQWLHMPMAAPSSRP
jgi:OPT oligopeptide transporter protein